MIAKDLAGRIVCAALILVLAPATPAAGVIIRGGDGSGNNTAPDDDPGWANVGEPGGGNAVYVGNGWMLTAAHVGPAPVLLGGKRYEVVPNTWHRISDPSRPGQTTDLGLFQIAGHPTGVRNLSICREPPPTGTSVLAIGNGRNRAPDLTTWYVDTHSQPNVWRDSPFPAGRSIRKGFKYANGQAKRWGKNQVNRICPEQDCGQGTACVIEMVFHPTGGCGDDEMQVSSHDSGGALFRKFNGTWQLAGILVTKGFQSGQPNDTAVFGNLSYAIDLSAYANEIKTTVYGPDDPLKAVKPWLIPAAASLAVVLLLAFLWHRHRRRVLEDEWSEFSD
jgi:hypothetical protein